MIKVKTQHQIEKYQDLYLSAWNELNKVDRTKHPSLRGPQHNHHNRATHVSNGRLGGAPMLTLTKEAETIDRMLNKDATVKEIAAILNMSIKDTNNIVRRFKLPR
jgi:hypothetical protein|tara:strand:- start:2743 stop:3057 length:315 start_codon:yes stop_codon:yes gene_type:complete